MAETQTPNFKWTKPDVGGDASTWGNVLNTTFDAIDSVAWNNQQAGSSIGDVKMFAGTTPPTNWLWCNGAVYLDTDIPALVPVLNHSFPGSDASHTAVPQMNGRSAVGYDGSSWLMGAAGGEYNHTLLSNEMPIHAHSASQDVHTHAASQPAHTHAVTQSGHTHNVYQDAHSHYVWQDPHSHGANQDAHSHGGVVTGAQTGTVFQLGATGTLTSGRTDTQQPGVHIDTQTPLVHADNQQPGIHIDVQTPSVSADLRQPPITVDTRQPNVYVGNAGGGGQHNNMSPYTVIGFIIRYR